jgi:hypothetical protein
MRQLAVGFLMTGRAAKRGRPLAIGSTRHAHGMHFAFLSDERLVGGDVTVHAAGVPQDDCRSLERLKRGELRDLRALREPGCNDDESQNPSNH